MDQPACEDSWTSHREVLFIPNYSTKQNMGNSAQMLQTAVTRKMVVPNYSTKQNMLLKCCNYAQNGSTKSTQSGHYIISDDDDADDDNDL